LLSLKAWMKARNLKKSDKVKILAAFNQINEGAPFDEKQVTTTATIVLSLYYLVFIAIAELASGEHLTASIL
jgi:hypothetical protein